MRVHSFEARIANMEGGFGQVNLRLTSIEHRLDSVDRRFDSLEHLTALRFDQVDRRFNWLTGIVVGTWMTTMLTILLHR